MRKAACRARLLILLFDIINYYRLILFYDTEHPVTIKEENEDTILYFLFSNEEYLSYFPGVKGETLS